jgi:magnesium-transporting ATPase (P-type)
VADLHLLLLLPLVFVCAAVNFAQGGSIFWAFVFGLHDMPLTAMQVLYVNLVTAVTMGESAAGVG